MTESLLIFWLVQAFILILGISVGRSVLMLKIRKEENKKRELELALFEKRTEILKHGKKIAQDLEDVLYKAKVQQEIEDIIRKNNPR